MQEENSNTIQESAENIENQTPAVMDVPKKSNTNTILTIANAVLFIGLVILYFLVLSPEKNNTPNYAVMQKMASGGSVTVAYVNSDSILTHYELVKSMRSELESKTTRLETELKKKQAAFEKDAAYFQEQVNKKAISEASAQEIYGQLMAEQQKLYDLREQYSAELSKQEYDLNLLLLDSLNNFLERYNKRMNFDYILSYNKGGSILTANDSLDITNDVLRLLNDEYSAAKK
ncbi:MAG: OmpH family outer membrane protein [Lentimicrobiaceae bacterium]|nr:OmpH family outer membrane protein [Lentimicrobiaceae bacterium]MCO5265091.1 OmpH family outer membrane protein [Lentimicrobium sp.]